MRKDLPEIPCVFISSMTQNGITELKDVIWTELNKESNEVTITHRNLEIKSRTMDVEDMEDEFDMIDEWEENDDEEYNFYASDDKED
jgi:GTP-binding protein